MYMMFHLILILSYCMPLGNALQILIGENYHCFLLTIRCNTVAVYCYGDGRFRIFDSHARNTYGFPDPQGSCILLDIDNFMTLINYFQSLYDNSTGLFELRGVRISELGVQSGVSENFSNALTYTLDQKEVNNKAAEDDLQSKNCFDANLNASSIIVRRCSAVLFYCICFSIIKGCKYWNSDTLDSLSEQGNIFYAQNFNKECCSINDLPASIQIYA